ncbi:hypothetical protein [Bradyrhizobium japonicum]|uniref:hypothetical protein n=1 Tax=Bradyrhizobium japonicum TaxID=375 RepID=UPI001BA696F1|nr:hypothetical protein [Bradyrhizobium japonicum]MBR0911756.1 hypothetical protein [Bradyrhizobium japonicum]
MLASLDPTHNHGNTDLWEVTYDVLRFGIELEHLAIDNFFERMPNQRFVLVVLDPHRM